MDRMLSVKDIRDILGCSNDKAYAIVRYKGFPSIKINRQYFTPKEEFDKWIKRNLYSEIQL